MLIVNLVIVAIMKIGGKITVTTVEVQAVLVLTITIAKEIVKVVLQDAAPVITLINVIHAQPTTLKLTGVISLIVSLTVPMATIELTLMLIRMPSFKL
jgi:hypothetical protein